MPDREKSTLHHLKPTFLRGPFLQHWDSVSEDLQPPFLESWAGPWEALRRDDTKALWAWEVRRSWDALGDPDDTGDGGREHEPDLVGGRAAGGVSPKGILRRSSPGVRVRF